MDEEAEDDAVEEEETDAGAGQVRLSAGQQATEISGVGMISTCDVSIWFTEPSTPRKTQSAASASEEMME